MLLLLLLLVAAFDHAVLCQVPEAAKLIYKKGVNEVVQKTTSADTSTYSSSALVDSEESSSIAKRFWNVDKATKQPQKEKVTKAKKAPEEVPEPARDVD